MVVFQLFLSSSTWVTVMLVQTRSLSPTATMKGTCNEQYEILLSTLKCYRWLMKSLFFSYSLSRRWFRMFKEGRKSTSKKLWPVAVVPALKYVIINTASAIVRNDRWIIVYEHNQRYCRYHCVPAIYWLKRNWTRDVFVRSWRWCYKRYYSSDLASYCTSRVGFIFHVGTEKRVRIWARLKRKKWKNYHNTQLTM